MEKYINIKDLMGEVLLIATFLAVAFGAIIAHKILQKRK
jgi:hypothetical protein